MDPTTRFSALVGNYVRHRPDYPSEALAWLQEQAPIPPGAVIADVGAGTGILSAALLDLGCVVHAVEPNHEMRQAAELLLGELDQFHSIDGRAEETGLPSHSFDGITAGQAFHWFDIDATRAEFCRILKPGGWVALLWNTRLVNETPFLRDYEDLLLRYGTDYTAVDHRNIDQANFERFFGAYQRKTFDHRQVVDYEGLRGRLLSTSYVPQEGHANHTPMLRELLRLFKNYQEQGTVSFLYETEVYFGSM